MSTLQLRAPVTGVMIPLDTVPDQAFALKMVGDGVSIDPIEDLVLAPCDGTVTLIHPARHALTITTADGVEVLIHVGLDTVMMRGDGFEPLVEQGATVTQGQPVLRFDPDKVIAGAVSLLTQMVIANTDAVTGLRPSDGFVTAGSDVALSYDLAVVAANSEGVEGPEVVSDPIVIRNPSGLHARPAAVLAGQAKAYVSTIRLHKGERDANAKSLTSIMTLEVGRGDEVRLVARGRDAAEAVRLLTDSILSGLGESVESAPGKPLMPEESSDPRPRRAVGGASDGDPDLIRGVGASPGLALGTVVRWESADIDVSTERLGSTTEERQAYERAVARARVQLADLERATTSSLGRDKAEIFAAHRELLDDPELTDLALAGITAGLSAGFAWKRAYTQYADTFAGLSNPLLAGRATDIRDVGMRVLSEIAGRTAEKPTLPPQAVLIARDLTPSDTATLDRDRVVGFVVVDGGATSHSAILAQSLGIPAIAGAESRVLDLPDGARVVLDGSAGTLRLNVPEAEMIAARERQVEAARRKRENQETAHLPATTTDGRTVEVVCNIGSLEDARAAILSGGEGVGLLRSEFVFMDRDTAPSEDEQAHLYAEVAQAVGAGRKLIIRTLDVGGDKPLPYLPIPPEENPFLGQRGIRVGLEHLHDVLRPQIRAVLKAAMQGGADIHLMFPMVSTLDEFRGAKAIVEEERAALGAPAIPVGIMVEVPAVAVMAEQFAREADFFSIGTNDLTQYTMAMDRGHAKLATQCDALNPGVLGLIKQTVEGAHAHGTWVGVCGAMASNPLAVPILLGLGVDELSAVVTAVADVKAVVRTVSDAECRTLADQALNAGNAADVRALLAEHDS